MKRVYAGLIVAGSMLGVLVGLTNGCSEDERIVNVNVPTPVPTLPMPAENTPLSSLVAVAINPATAIAGSPTTDIPAYVKSLMARYDAGTLPAGSGFPLAVADTDEVRAIPGTTVSIVARWMDPINDDPSPKRFGANTDYTAYFGDGWDANWTVPGQTPGATGNAPQWAGSDTAGYIWANHEYISGTPPTPTAAPTDSCLAFARFLKEAGVLTNDVEANVWAQSDIDTFARNYKRQLGGSWFRVVKNSNNTWQIDRSAPAERYDSTSNTLARVTGHNLAQQDYDDNGTTLPFNVVPGIAGDCSGGTSPWGTIFTAEENVQDYYGDLEPCWTSQQKFVAGVGFDPGSNVSPPNAPNMSGAFGFGNMSRASEQHLRESHGWLVEIDPGVPAGQYYTSVNAGGDGSGHRKVGAFGRARWENVTFVTDDNWRLVDGQPIVMYAGNDRRSGHVYKFVSSLPYSSTMDKGQIRALLNNGSIYVAHFADLDNSGSGNTLIGRTDGGSDTVRGNGEWILLSTTNTTQTPPNATALGQGAITVGAALQDVNYNGIGGFPDDDMVRRATFTAALKLGIREMNRPEDLEYNPKATLSTGATAQVLYIALTNHGRRCALDDDGVLLKGTDHDDNAVLRDDPVGAILALEEGGNPATSTTFTFWRVWHGSQGSEVFDAANVDNLMIDRDGGVWFGTDGNWGRNGHSDALYLLNLTPGSPNYGRGFRVIAGPSNSEATGPAFTPGQTTLFFGAQHPGEDGEPSTWPWGR